ncbi:FAD-dependent monooxygenase [Mycolicibacterium sp.]|uniref:FAD-dependent oxidoreductase n=1 Tax=Mycolicibacterium sp. TaxID=2320850 RepID=UPI001A1F8921|nr:FAD-dependent monooxygenase [Mycolicibacterium sp.]MBJ7338203.1 FAD-dependent monooxygenase [Mycolicibacterium sp.]
MSGYVAANESREWVESLDIADDAVIRDLLAHHLLGWAHALADLVPANASRPVLRHIHALPADHRWESVPGVTLLGDAAHLMSPFAGQCVTLAMFDGADLARHLAATPADSEPATRTHERAMSLRSAEVARQCGQCGAVFGDDVPHGVVD